MTLLKSFFLIAVASLPAGLLGATTTSKTCQLVWSSQLPSFFPLIWNNSDIIYPSINASGSLSITIPSKTSIQIGCSDPPILFGNYSLAQTTVQCDTTGKLKVGTTATNFTSMGCNSQLKEKVIQNGECYNGYDNVDIQFNSSLKSFPLITICHNADLDESIMAQHVIRGGALNSFEVSNKRPSFKKAQYYKTISADDSYSQSSQLSVVSDLVGSKTLGMKYIDASKSYYFARGHLAPDGDFVHIYEQNATYYFINVVPQWQAINNGNWKGLEMAVRNLAISGNRNIKVWTGGKGVLTLEKEDGTPVNIYLGKNSRLPVPQISWKVIQDPVAKTAVAIFMINNPHLNSVPENLILCPDICSQLSWVKWNTTNIQKGYTYCCELSKVKTVLPMLPSELETMKILSA